MFSFPEDMTPLREAAARKHDMADVRSSSISCTVPGGWPTPLVDHGVIRKFPLLTSLDDVAEHIRVRVEEENSDYIKLLVDTREWSGRIPTMDMNMVEEIVKEAHKHNKLAICHIHDAGAAYDVVEHGVDGLAHLFVDESRPGFAKLCAEKGAFVIGTLTLVASLTGECLSDEISRHPQVLKYAPPQSIELLRRDAAAWGCHKNAVHNVVHAWKGVRELHQAGVPVLVGSDALKSMVPSIAHGVTVHNEMWMLVDKCGFTPVEALQSATSKTATAFRFQDRGLIEPSKLADLVLVDGDPTTDIRKTIDIVSVWRSGQLVDRDSLKERVWAGFAQE